MLKQKQNLAAIFIIIIVNLLFVIKYSFVYSTKPYLIISGYVIAFPVFLILLFGYFNINSIKNIGRKKITWAVVVFNLLVLIIVAILPEMYGRIGRLPAINEWLSLFLSKKFPYYAFTTPSGFPMLFFFALPFYITGLLKFFVLLGVFIFSFFALKTYSSTKELVLQFTLLLTSPLFFYDLLVKSELFFNMMLAILLFYLILRYSSKSSKKQIIFFGILAGLVLSTRSTVAVIYILFFVPFFRKEFPNLVLFGFITLAVFLLTLLPFVIWDLNGFIQKGPFAVQSFLSYLPKYIIILFMVAVFFISVKIYGLNTFFFQTGFLMFLIVIFSYFIKVAEFGWYVALVQDKIDLSYLDFCLPFLILSVKEKPAYNLILTKIRN